MDKWKSSFSSCDPSQIWDLNSWTDMMGYFASSTALLILVFLPSKRSPLEESMKQRSLVSAICALLFEAPSSFARERHWFTEPGTPVVLESSGFVFRASLPRGWSLTTDQVIVPPPAF